MTTLNPSAHADTSRDVKIGVIYGIAAYGAWGLVPLYFKAVSSVPALEVLAHRIVWSVVLLAIFITGLRRWPAVVRCLREGRTLATLALTTILIAANWFVFIYAVATNRVLDASLGYFINPLVNVLLGFVFLRERLRRRQTLCVLLAIIGVSIRAQDGLPWIALVLAFSFGFYGLLRKVARADAMVGLTVETTLLMPFAAAFLIYESVAGRAAFAAVSIRLDLLLVAAGIVTAVPLLWFANAAKRLRLTTLGFLQYLAPTGHFLIGAFVFGEPLAGTSLVSFAFIWVALGLYTWDSWNARSMRQLAR